MSRCERRDNKKKKSVRRVSKEKKTDRSRGINLNVSFFSSKNWIFTRVNRVIINCNERLSSVYRGCTKGCINNGFLIKPVRSWTLPIPPFRDRDAGEPVRQPCNNFWTAKFRLTRSSFNDSILIQRSIEQTAHYHSVHSSRSSSEIGTRYRVRMSRIKIRSTFYKINYL